MIKYTLKCEENHTFDSWFQSAEAFDKLLSAGMVTCAVCGALGVEKAIMAPSVAHARSRRPEAPQPDEDRPLSAPASPAEQTLAELRRQIEANAEDVGENFAREARAIHEGTRPERSIFGKAKPDEARSLIEDGVPVVALPWGNKRGN
jgi:hypothetical protein